MSRSPAAPDDRDARLRAALRANLNRRKDQARARAAAEADAAPAADAPTTHDNSPDKGDT